jgi:metal-sulfur cluster biosynthetic enzyme
MVTEQDILLKLKNVVDPELRLNIVDLGLVYEVNILNEKHVHVVMTLTSPGCPIGPMLQHQVEQELIGYKGIEDVKVDVVFDPPWDPSKMSDDAKLELGFNI